MPYERRYPPTPYAPKSDETAWYRDAWDLGWRHLATIGAARSRSYYEGLTDGPSKRGYLDGVRARWRYEEKAAEGEREARAKAREAQRAEWAREALDEGPY